MFGWSIRRNQFSATSTVTCHFCQKRYALQCSSLASKSRSNQSLQTVRGNWSSFRCLRCESWNLRDPSTGSFVDNPQLYSDASMKTRVQLVKRPESLQQIDTGTPFCTECISNQNLQIQLLAAYIPTVCTGNEEAQLLGHFENYRAGLQNRYPLVCEDCSGRVDKIIEERNCKAKSRIIGGWLKHSAKLAKIALPLGANGNSNYIQQSHLGLWRLKGLCWKLLYGGTIVMSSCKESTLERMLGMTPHYVQLSFNLPAVAIISILCSFWDPTYGERIRREGRVQVIGKERWLVSEKSKTSNINHSESDFACRFCKQCCFCLGYVLLSSLRCKMDYLKKSYIAWLFCMHW